MIHLIDDYYVLINSTEYILSKNTHKLNAKGEEIYNNISYHSTLKNAIKSFVTNCFKDSVIGDVIEFNEAISRLDDIYDKFKHLLDDEVKW